MRTMYIILSWIGWGWLLMAGVAVLLLERRHLLEWRRRRAVLPRGFAVEPKGDDGRTGSGEAGV